MKMKKLFFSFLLLLPFIASNNVFAEEIPNDEIWYTSTDGNMVTPYNSDVFGATIVSNTCTGGKGIIKFNDKVASIGNYAFNKCSRLTSITIPNSVTSIREGAFSQCTNLTSITIPNSVTSIGIYAFASCIKLASITIPNSVTSINDYTFSECFSLASIAIGNSVRSITRFAFNNCYSLTSIKVDAENSVYDSRNNCNAIIRKSDNTLIVGCKNTIIPNSVTSIGYDAFYDCSSLASITIPNSVKSIGYRAFYGCSSLTSITIPNSVTSIGYGAFSSCSKLTNVYCYSDIVPSTGMSVFNNVPLSSATLYVPKNSINSYQATSPWSEFSTITELPPPNDEIWYEASEKLTETTGQYRNGLHTNAFNTTISSHTFANGKGIIKFNDDVTNIKICAFYYCSSLTSIKIPNSVTSIGSSAFYGCSNLASIALPDSVTSIEYNTFCNCSNLTSIKIPNSVTTIKEQAFSTCSSLTKVYCYAEKVPSTTGNYLFYSVPLTSATLYVPENSIDSYKATSPWNEFGTIKALLNVIVTDLKNHTSQFFLKSNDTFSLSDNIKSIEITDTIPSVNLTYTRNFSDAMVNNWQAWYMPCDFAYDDLSEDFDVAEVAGVLFDKDGQNYVAFRKMTEGTVKAHTPYVVRAKEAGDAVITATTTLQPTSGAKSFSMQSAYNNFTFGGVYENSYLSAVQPTYALNKSGNFSVMASDVYLRPFRIYMRIADREDNPYAAVTAPQEVKVVVLGEDETSIENVDADVDVDGEIYNLAGQKLQKLQKGINIVNGRKVLY